MGSRESPAGSNRLLINVGIEMLGKSDDVVPSAVFFDLRTRDDGGVAARIESANKFVQRSRIGRCARAYFASSYRLAVVSPVVHGNRKKNGTHGRLHGEVVGAGDGGWNVLRAERLVRPFHVGLDCFHGTAVKKRFGKKLAAILLAGGNDQGNVAVPGIDDGGESIAGAGDGMQIHKHRLSLGQGIAERHAGGRAFMEAEDVLEIGGHVAQERQFGGTGVAEDDGHAQVAQELIGDFSYRAQRHAPSSIHRVLRGAKVIPLWMQARCGDLWSAEERAN